MDKYQMYLMDSDCAWEKNSENQRIISVFESQKTGRKFCGDINFDTGIITVNQDSDIYSHVYAQYFPVPSHVSGISVTYDGKKWEKLAIEKERDCVRNCLCSGKCKIILDFENRIKKVKFAFACAIADDLIFTVRYVEADKQAYYAEIAHKEMLERIKKANIQIKTGLNLVNIFFCACSDDYVRTEFQLYTDSGQLMKKIKVPEDEFFVAVPNLAYGRYYFIAEQFASDKKLFTTEKIEFQIKKPYTGEVPLRNINGNW